MLQVVWYPKQELFYLIMSLTLNRVQFNKNYYTTKNIKIAKSHPAGDVTRVSVVSRKMTVKIGDAENWWRGCQDKNGLKKAKIPARLVLSRVPFQSRSGVSSDRDGYRGALKREVFFHTFFCILVRICNQTSSNQHL